MDVNELYKKWKYLHKDRKISFLQNLSIEEKLELLKWTITQDLKEDYQEIFILLPMKEKEEIIALFLKKHLLEWWVTGKGTLSPCRWEIAVGKFKQVNALIIYYYDEIAKRLFKHLSYILCADIIDATKDRVAYEQIMKTKDDIKRLQRTLHGITMARYWEKLIEYEIMLSGMI